MPHKTRGHSIIEYAMIIGVVSAAFIAMSIYLQRATQANLKLVQTQIVAEEVEGSEASIWGSP